MPQNPFAISVEDVVSSLGSHIEKGLGEHEVQRRLESYGPNEVPEQAPKKRWRILADQLLDPIIYILAVAALLAFMFDDPLEGMPIVATVALAQGMLKLAQKKVVIKKTEASPIVVFPQLSTERKVLWTI